MNEAQMLHQATQEALRGDYVVVSCYNLDHGKYLIEQLSQSVPEYMIKGTTFNPLKITLGTGNIQFVNVDSLEKACRGKRGAVFQLDLQERTWTQFSRFVRKEIPTRFARILAESSTVIR
jgi:hypothetical protein